jgi:hypothetical protein
MEKSNQTYQELLNIVKEELPFVKGNKQMHFFIQKKINPRKYERLYYDENGEKPYSKTLEDIFFDIKLSEK